MFSFLRPNAGPACPPVAEIAAAVARGEMVLVDVRETAELRGSGKAKGALHVPLGLLALKADPQAPDAVMAPGKPVVLYCASGGRSGMAAQTLRRMGYDPVWNLGGFGDWVAGGGQVDRA
ncbi:rhodanese-like domain-containing protein [Pseudogemmobacter blasticus]|uniref:Sulfurtransferase n=1 Tax=Fuscovulum blasticum DSM 2131 TaxID=1188250 RepID=A0A2T4J792_FUSBL|nr:rhodanese-like domain-containing protein [Fuscovulum blasticum]PTE13772.1 sulfurtransferase [Fuscovulum blasticum DSM 2131]